MKSFALAGLASLLVLMTGCGNILPPSYGIEGRIVDKHKDICYLVDVGSIYKPDQNTAIFIVAIVEKDGTQLEWVVEADLNEGYFVRGIGPYYFVKWPSDVVLKAIEMVKAYPYEPPSGELELLHPLGDFTPGDRTEYVYSQVGNPDFRKNLLTGVKSWAMKRAVEGRAADQ